LFFQIRHFFHLNPLECEHANQPCKNFIIRQSVVRCRVGFKHTSPWRNAMLRILAQILGKSAQAAPVEQRPGFYQPGETQELSAKARGRGRWVWPTRSIGEGGWAGGRSPRLRMRAAGRYLRYEAVQAGDNCVTGDHAPGRSGQHEGGVVCGAVGGGRAEGRGRRKMDNPPAPVLRCAGAGQSFGLLGPGCGLLGLQVQAVQETHRALCVRCGYGRWSGQLFVVCRGWPSVPLQDGSLGGVTGRECTTWAVSVGDHHLVVLHLALRRPTAVESQLHQSSKSID